MKYNFDEFINKINESDSEEEIEQFLNDWEIDINEEKEWIDNIFSEKIYNIDMNKMPKVLDVLYRTDNKFKFMMFCMFLEATIDSLPYITNLEDVSMFVEKWKMLKNTISVLVKDFQSGITDCLFLILLNADPKGEYLTEEEKSNIIEGVNKNLSDIYNYITTEKNIDDSAYSSLEVILDVSVYLNDNETIELLKKFNDIELPDFVSMFLVKTLLVNEVSTCEKTIDKLLINDEIKYRFLRILTNINKLEDLKISQVEIAIALMNDWLIYPTELGELPADIKFVEKLEIDEIEYYVFKFTSNKSPFCDRGWMLGVAGGFEKNVLTTQNNGFTFSKFETIGEDYKKQVKDIIMMIQEQWRKSLEE